MPRVETVIIGAGQAGLSLSRQLVRARQTHVVLERGRVGERWRSERWRSLTLLTPNWLNRLDGAPGHADPDGYLARDPFVAYLEDYARAAAVPVREDTSVLRVERGRTGFRVATDAGTYRARNVVLATGDCDVVRRPPAAAHAPRELAQVDANRYRDPSQLAPGGVLVVGAGPSGQQLAAELRRAGREVVLAAGGHARMPRRYRGRDIWSWLERMGDLDATLEDLGLPANHRSPSLTLSGSNGGEQLDLGVLHDLGVVVAGRLAGFERGRALFSDGLAELVADADRHLRATLESIDDHIARNDADATLPEPDPPPDVRLPDGPRSVEVVGGAITTVLWATGFRRTYPWLDVPVLDDAGEVVHRRGITSVPGLYVLGRRFQRRRASHLIGGVGADAACLAGHLVASGDPVAERRRRRAPTSRGVRIATA